MENAATHSSFNRLQANAIAIPAAIPMACAALVFVASMWNAVDINTTNVHAELIELDWPVMIKLGIALCCGLVGTLGVLYDARIRGSLVYGPGLLLSLLAIVFVATSTVAYAEVANVCRAAALIYVAYLMFIPTALLALGLRNFIIAAIAGMVINLLAGWVLYLFVPEVGVFEEHLASSTLAMRMGGLGHPNAIGRIAVLAGLLSLAMLRSRVHAGRAVARCSWV
jgi:exopolysaccharide production protein ExoQ